MSEIAYVSKVRIERKVGPPRIAYLPGESQAVTFLVGEFGPTEPSLSITRLIQRRSIKVSILPPINPMATYRMLWPKTTQNGSKTRQPTFNP